MKEKIEQFIQLDNIMGVKPIGKTICSKVKPLKETFEVENIGENLYHQNDILEILSKYEYYQHDNKENPKEKALDFILNYK